MKISYLVYLAATIMLLAIPGCGGGQPEYPAPHMLLIEEPRMALCDSNENACRLEGKTIFTLEDEICVAWTQVDRKSYDDLSILVYQFLDIEDARTLVFEYDDSEFDSSISRECRSMQVDGLNETGRYKTFFRGNVRGLDEIEWEIVSSQGEPIFQSITNNYLSSINAVVTNLRFFNSEKTLTPKDQRTYSYSFDQATSNYICWEVSYNYQNPEYRYDFTVRAIYYNSDGSILHEHDVETYILPEWNSSYTSKGYKMTDTELWKKGVYTVVLLIDNTEIVRASFTIE